MFLLAVVGLSCLSKHSFSSELHGLKVAPTAPAVSHLLFADGSLLPFKAETVVVAKVQGVLDLYCMASGQQINRDKSSIFFSKRCPGAIKEGVKLSLQVQSESLMSTCASILVDSVGPPRTEFCRTAASFP
jgi:hypothetical protein